MPEVDIEADPFLKLLTDALRAGPGSPQWHEAVGKLRAARWPARASAQMNTRCSSAPGRIWPAGVTFAKCTPEPDSHRKLLTGLEKETTGGVRRSLPTATIIAIAAGIIVLAVLAVVGWKLMPGAEPGHGAIDELVSTYFPNESTVAFR